MTKTLVRAPVAPDRLAAARAAHVVAVARRDTAAEKLASLRSRHEVLSADVHRQSAALTAKGDAMVAQPGAETNEAFRVATADLAVQEGQCAALMQRFIPQAESELATASEALRAAWGNRAKAQLSTDIRTRLIPADTAVVGAIDALEAAMEANYRVRTELISEYGYNDLFAKTALNMAARSRTIMQFIYAFPKSFGPHRPTLLEWDERACAKLDASTGD